MTVGPHPAEVDRSEWEATQRRLAAVEAALARLESSTTTTMAAPAVDLRPATTDGGVEHPPSPSDEPPGAAARIDRRQAFGKMAGAAAAGVLAGAVLSDGQPAGAANGSALILGSVSNTASVPTGVAVTGSGVSYGFGVTDNGPSSLPLLQNPAVLGHANGTAFSHAGQMIAQGPAVGLTVDSVDGYGALIYCTNSTALVSNAVNGDAASFGTSSSSHAGVSISSSGIGMSIETTGDTQARLQTRSGTTAPAPPATTQTHFAGDLQVDTDGEAPAFEMSPRSNLWFCVADGQPGAWRKLAGPATAGAFHVLPTPIRVYDSRPGTSPSTPPKTPLVANTARVLDVTVNGSGVPKGATAVMCNLLVVNATAGNGNFTIWANGVARPAANNMVWGGSTGRFSSLAVSALDASAKCQVSSSVGTDFVLDIVGYYR
ncbi:MAG: hypothetical protein JWP02_463 [Acidimicrobiales bacterium]|nr:hypothetical protein [Acidimicrobiales bacterium]